MERGAAELELVAAELELRAARSREQRRSGLVSSLVREDGSLRELIGVITERRTNLCT